LCPVSFIIRCPLTPQNFVRLRPWDSIRCYKGVLLCPTFQNVWLTKILSTSQNLSINVVKSYFFHQYDTIHSSAVFCR
jgi:hypothetical protein